MGAGNSARLDQALFHVEPRGRHSQFGQGQRRLGASDENLRPASQQALEYGFVDHLREFASDVVGGGGTDDASKK